MDRHLPGVPSVPGWRLHRAHLRQGILSEFDSHRHGAGGAGIDDDEPVSGVLAGLPRAGAVCGVGGGLSVPAECGDQYDVLLEEKGGGYGFGGGRGQYGRW